MAPARLSLQELERYRADFAKFASPNGTLDVWNLRGLLATSGQDPSDDELFALVQEVDEDHNGTISFDEYIHLVEMLRDERAGFEDDPELFAAWYAAGGALDKSGRVQLESIAALLEDQRRAGAVLCELEAAHRALISARAGGLGAGQGDAAAAAARQGVDWADFASLLAEPGVGCTLANVLTI